MSCCHHNHHTINNNNKNTLNKDSKTMESHFEKQIMIDQKDLPNAETVEKMNIRVAVVRTQWHEKLVNSITQKYVDEMILLGVTDPKHIVEVICPGTWEIPFVVSQLLIKGFDAIICFGVLIEGETKHFDLIAESVTHRLMKIQCKSGIPILNSIFCCHNEDQAFDRTAGSKSNDLAKSLAISTVAMANIKRTLPFMAIQ